MYHSINKTITLPVGDLQIYVNPQQEAEARALIRKCPQILKNGYEKGCIKFAQGLLKIVRKSLNTGQPPSGTYKISWPPHSQHTIRKYGEHTLLKLTGQYARSVAIRRQPKNNNIFVGLPPNVPKQKRVGKNQGSVYDDNNVTLNQVALILERGGGSIPPRPLWRPAWYAMGGTKELRKVIKRYIQIEVRRYKKNARLYT